MSDFLSSLRNCHLKTELLAGITTFLTMVYIVFVNPVILGQAGMDQGAVFTATCLVTAFACALTGVFANTPIGVAPGMALNIFFSYSVVQGQGMPWQQALAMVFVAGVLFFIVTLTPLRRLLIDAMPANLQIAILVGISLLIALIALNSNGIIVSDPHTLLQLGDLARPESLMFLLGFVLILLLDAYRVRGAIIISILSISAVSLALGLTSWHGVIAHPPSMMPTFLQLDFSGFWHISALKATFTFFLISVFDATGTLMGLLNQSLFREGRKHQQQLSRSLTADAAASALAGLLGSASTSPYIESATGIEAGGRTGVTAVVVAMGFVLMLFFFPLAQNIPSFAVGPALLYVACCMMRHLTEMRLNDITEVVPCALTILFIPFTASIAEGIGAGLIFYTLLKLFTRQKPNALVLTLTVLFLVLFCLR